MTQEQALARLQELRPDSKKLAVSRDRRIGYMYGDANHYFLWDGHSIVGSSTHSWENALSELIPESNAPFEDEVPA